MKLIVIEINGLKSVQSANKNKSLASVPTTMPWVLGHKFYRFAAPHL